jgi:F0F1-type ATP synthase assembly protein I
MDARDEPGPESDGGAMPTRDPRLEIPEVLRQPVRRPASMKDRPNRESDRGDWSDMAMAWGLAMEFVFSILGGLVLGWLLDRWLGTGPTFVIVGLAAGFVLAFIRIVKQSAKGAKGPGHKRK